MNAAGSGARFAAILWHQGEADISASGGDDYPTNHWNLMRVFRNNITGATDSTPIVVGEMNPCFVAGCPERTTAKPSPIEVQKVLNYFHTLPDTKQNVAWVSSAGLYWRLDDGTHFDLPSIRELGRRYADKLFEAQNNLPQPLIDLKVSKPFPTINLSSKFFNVGRLIDNDPLSARIDGNVSTAGTVSNFLTTEHGYAVKIDNAAGALSIPTDGTLFNGSYTKMAWVKLNSYSNANNLISGVGSVQRHHLNVVNGKPSAGHGYTTTTFVQNPTTIPTGSWTHVSVVYNAPTQTMQLYVNGVLTDTSAATPAPTQTEAMDLQLSRYSADATITRGIDGAMIDNKVYNTALDSSQISKIYNFELTKKAGY